ncbi:MAG: translation elongation factor Ts [Myxococcota bacterium]|nr:translation elongation factor Ts [Myxococcota bacterium]
MSISAKDVAALRRETGAGMMDCKKALVESEGDIGKAKEYLQKKSLAAIGKRAGRTAAEGVVGSYIHNGRIGVLVELNSETDFVARNEDFQRLAKDVAMHIAATNPEYVDSSEIPADYVAKQKEIFLAQMEDAGKPANILERIVEGKLKKWKSEICLLDQAFVRDTDKTINELVIEVAAVVKENIKIRRFVRFELGEGIEKEETDFAAEVAAATAG